MLCCTCTASMLSHRHQCLLLPCYHDLFITHYVDGRHRSSQRYSEVSDVHLCLNEGWTRRVVVQLSTFPSRPRLRDLSVPTVRS